MQQSVQQQIWEIGGRVIAHFSAKYSASHTLKREIIEDAGKDALEAIIRADPKFSNLERYVRTAVRNKIYEVLREHDGPAPGMTPEVLDALRNYTDATGNQIIDLKLQGLSDSTISKKLGIKQKQLREIVRAATMAFEAAEGRHAVRLQPPPEFVEPTVEDVDPGLLLDLKACAGERAMEFISLVLAGFNIDEIAELFGRHRSIVPKLRSALLQRFENEQVIKQPTPTHEEISERWEFAQMPGTKSNVNILNCLKIEMRLAVTPEAVRDVIQETYGFVPEVRPGTYTVTGRLTSDAFRARADRIREGRRDRNIQLILNTLCADGVVPAATYEIGPPLPCFRQSPEWRDCLARLLNQTVPA